LGEFNPFDDQRGRRMFRFNGAVPKSVRAGREARNRAAQRRAVYRVECLEDRRLLSGVTYSGGRLIQNAVIVPIFYGSAWTAPAQANEIVMLDTFMKYIASATSPLVTFLSSQYDVTPRTHGYRGASYSIDGGTLWSGNRLEPTGNDIVDARVAPILIDGTDPSIIEQEINEGRVPAPTASTIYVLFTPPGVSVYDAERAGVPIGREWYGFHDAFGYSGSPTGFAYYAGITSPGDPSETLMGSVGGQPLNAFQSLTEILTHELTESITDPNSNGSGWNDRKFPDDGEIADMGLEPSAFDQRHDFYQRHWLTVLDDYIVPQLWSNKAKGPASLPGAKPAATAPATTSGHPDWSRARRIGRSRPPARPSDLQLVVDQRRQLV
jgi:hypothetical protein